MLVETLIFVIVSFILFVCIFWQLVKKNDTRYVPILAIEAIGIAAKLADLYINTDKINIFIEVIAYLLSVVIPIGVIALDKVQGNLLEIITVGIAKTLLVFGNTKKAKKILIELVSRNPNSFIGHKLLGKIYEKEGGQRKAVDEYAQAISINQKEYEIYFKVATLLTDLDKKDEAIDTLTNLLSKKPDYPEATVALGDLLIEKEDYKEAANIYNEALKYNPTNFELNYNLGIVYTMLNDFSNAKLYYEKAAELNTIICNTKYSLAEIAIMYKELEEAEKYLMEVLDDEELSADAYLELSKIYILKNDKERAIQYANVAIQEEPRRIVEKIKKDTTFAIIIAKLSIPFNLDVDEEKQHHLSKKEMKAKEHLEEMVEITKKIGFADLKIEKKPKQEKMKESEKERED